MLDADCLLDAHTGAEHCMQYASRSKQHTAPSTHHMGCSTQDAVYRMWMQDAGCMLQTAWCTVKDAGYRM